MSKNTDKLLFDYFAENEHKLLRCPRCGQRVMFTQDTQCIEDSPEDDKYVTIRIQHVNPGYVRAMCLGFSHKYSNDELEHISMNSKFANAIVNDIIHQWNNQVLKELHSD